MCNKFNIAKHYTKAKGIPHYHVIEKKVEELILQPKVLIILNNDKFLNYSHKKYKIFVIIV